jgi:hypothetical protein
VDASGIGLKTGGTFPAYVIRRIASRGRHAEGFHLAESIDRCLEPQFEFI